MPSDCISAKFLFYFIHLLYPTFKHKKAEAIHDPCLLAKYPRNIIIPNDWKAFTAGKYLMKAPLFTVLSMVIICVASNPSLGKEEHQTRDVLKRGGEWNPQGPYREPSHNYPYPPYYYPYSYPYYPYPSITQQRYWESSRSPYESLDVKPAGGISIVIQPLDAQVFVDGYKLTQGEDLTYEVGLVTGLHSSL